MQIEWGRCQLCGSKTRVNLQKGSVLLNFPLYCPKCRKESLIKAEELKIKVIREPDV